MTNKITFIVSNLFCTFFKVGCFKYMPGTLGSLIGLVLGVSLKNFLSLQIYIILILSATILAIFAINVYQSKMGKKDRSEIIIDEIIGQQIPIILFQMNILNIFLSFILFRFFDILKIYPANYIDKNYPNSIGIIGDDVVAGFQASFILYLITIIL